MGQDFCKGRLTKRHGIEVLLPDQDDRRLVQSGDTPVRLCDTTALHKALAVALAQCE
jgi:aspartate/glutamate racemase